MSEGLDVFASAEESRSVHKFEFNGSAGELIPIALVNLFFNIITLSLFRFWGRTRVRRYLWSRTSIMGDPFEYTGNGKELFIGFVVVLLLIFAPFYIIVFWAQTAMLTDPGSASAMIGVAYIFLLYLFGVGWYRAQKFRLSRTSWRGIRGGLEDNGYKYGLKFLGYTFLTLITFGLAAPYSANKLWSAESNTRRFGTAEYSYDGKASEFYGRFFGAVGLFIIFNIILTVTLGLITWAGQTEPAGTLTVEERLVPYMPLMVFGYFLIIFIATAVITFYEFGKMRTFWSHTKLENAEFVFTGTFGGMLKMVVGNFFLEVFTLGILHPVAQMRWLRYFATNLEIHGDLDLEAISQREGEAMSYGEGLAEGFDFGGV